MLNKVKCKTIGPRVTGKHSACAVLGRRLGRESARRAPLAGNTSNFYKRDRRKFLLKVAKARARWRKISSVFSSILLFGKYTPLCSANVIGGRTHLAEETPECLLFYCEAVIYYSGSVWRACVSFNINWTNWWTSYSSHHTLIKKKMMPWMPISQPRFTSPQQGTTCRVSGFTHLWEYYLHLSGM